MAEVGDAIRISIHEDDGKYLQDVYQDLVATAGNVFFVTDEIGHLVYVNSAVESVLGFSPNELMEKHFSEIVHPDCRERIVRYYTNQFLQMIPETMIEFEVLASNGERRWIEQIVRLMVEDGNIIGCNGLLHDITRRKRAEESAKALEQISLMASENSEAIIFIVNQDGLISYANPALERATGYSKTELTGMHVIKLIHPDENVSWDQFLDMRTDGQLLPPRSEVRVLKKDGSDCWLDIASNWGEVNGIPTIVGSALDITDRKRIEKDLKESQFLIEKINSTVPDIIYVIDIEAVSVVYWNRSFGSLLGYISDDAKDREFGELTDHLHPDEHTHFYARIESYQQLKDWEVSESTYRMRHKDGHWCMLHLRNTVFERDSVTGSVRRVLGLARDVTEQTQTVESLQKSEEQSRTLLQLQRELNEINIELGDIDTFDELCEQAVEWGHRRLGFDRLGLILYDESTGMIRGTFGIDQQGQLRDERWFKQPISRFTDWLSESVQAKKRVRVRENTDLYDKGEIISKGWNALALMWNGEGVIGWLAADNLIGQEPLQEYQLELLGLYASALEHLYVRKRAEEALRESNKRFDELVKNVPGVVYRRRQKPDGISRYEYVSPLCKEITGIEAEALLEDPDLWFRQIVPEDVASFQSMVVEFAENLQVFEWEGAVTINGERRWRRIESRPSLIKDGSIVWDGLVTDITERRVAEEAVRLSEERYRTMVEQQTELISLYTPDTRMIFVNEVLCRQVGRTREELIGQSILIDIPTMYHAEILALIDNAGATGETFRHEHPIQLANGSMRWIEWTDTPLYDSSGKLERFQSVGRDIDDRKRTEVERNDYITRLEIIRRVDLELTEGLNYDHVLQIAVDAAIRISKASAGAIHLLEDDKLRVAHVVGKFPNSLVGQTVPLDQGIVGRVARRAIPELISDVNLDPDYLPNVIETQAQMTLPLVSQDRLIGVLNVQTSEPNLFARPMFEFLKVLAVRIASALDNARLHYKTEMQVTELTGLYQQVSELEQLKTQMIRIAAHDLRNPLGVISGYIQMLQDELSPHMNDRSHEQIQAIRDSILRIDKITRDILTLERIAAGSAMLSERVDLTQLVKDAFAQIKMQATQKLQDFRLEKPDQPLFVKADRFLLPETCINLLTNAVKYTPEGGSIQVQLAVEGKLAVFTVVDTGFGIPLDQQQDLFQAFYRVRTKETKGISGTGLGLHLVKTIIERHNGKMRFQSEYGKGSTFGFELPIVESGTTHSRKRDAVRK